MFTMRIEESAPFFLSLIKYFFFSLPPSLSPFSLQNRQTFIHASNGDHNRPSSPSPFIIITLHHHHPSSPSFPPSPTQKLVEKGIIYSIWRGRTTGAFRECRLPSLGGVSPGQEWFPRATTCPSSVVPPPPQHSEKY